MNTTLTKQQARRFVLAHQGLWPPHELEGKRGVVNYIRRVGCIQFDPLDIVGHNPELVLQARVADFSPEMLQELLYQDRKLLDGWDKVMSIYRVEDWPYFQRQREAERRSLDKRSQITAILPEVRQVIQEQGHCLRLTWIWIRKWTGRGGRRGWRARRWRACALRRAGHPSPGAHAQSV